MNNSGTGEKWLYLIDDEVLETVLRVDPGISKPTARPLQSKEAVRAIALYLDGKAQEAIEILEEAAAEGEAAGQVSPDIYSTLGQMLFEVRKLEPAAECFSRLLHQDSGHPTAHYNLGVCLERLGRWKEARDAFESAVIANPDKVEAALGLAICQLHMSEPQRALLNVERYLRLHPENETAVFARAVSLQLLERFDEAADVYGHLLARKPDSAELHTNMIALGLASQDYAMVQEHAGRLLAAKRHSQPALEGLLASALARGEWEEAAHYSGELLKAVPESFEGWFNRGVAAQKLGRMAEAVEAYVRATELRPQDPAAFVNLALVRDEAGDTVGARKAYEKALALFPESPGAQWNLALLALRQGEIQTAEDMLEQVVAEWPEMEEAWFQLGWVRLERQRWDEAALAFDKCLADRPGWPEAAFNAGIAHWRAGDGLKARQQFEEVRVSGGNLQKEALRALCVLAIEEKNADDALRWVSLVGAGYPELSYNTALLLQTAERTDEAVPFYFQALEHKPEMVEAMINLGLAFQTLGQKDEARKLWRRALATAPEQAAVYFES